MLKTQLTVYIVGVMETGSHFCTRTQTPAKISSYINRFMQLIELYRWLFVLGKPFIAPDALIATDQTTLTARLAGPLNLRSSRRSNRHHQSSPPANEPPSAADLRHWGRDFLYSLPDMPLLLYSHLYHSVIFVHFNSLPQENYLG